MFFCLHYWVLAAAWVKEGAPLPASQGGLYPRQVSGAHQEWLTVQVQRSFAFVEVVAEAVY